MTRSCSECHRKQEIVDAALAFVDLPKSFPASSDVAAKMMRVIEATRALEVAVEAYRVTLERRRRNGSP